MDEQKKVIFPEGVFFEKVAIEKAPWIKGKLSFNVNEFCKWLQANVNDRGYVNVDLKLSAKTNKIYLQKNEWKPKETFNPSTLSKEDAVEVKAFREAQQKEVLNYPTEDLTPNF